MAKGDKFYFDNFTACASLCKDAAVLLVECLENYDTEKIEDMLEKMHVLEHSADIQKHYMSDALARAFVTPLDREDLDMLSGQLDNVADTIEEILQKIYIFNLRQVPPPAIEFAKKLVDLCQMLFQMMSEFENYKAEVKEKWGKTDAYKEHAEKTKNYSKENWNSVNDGLMAVFADFAACVKNGETADSAPAQDAVKKLQAYITNNFYTCTSQILAGLGQMYVQDERFRENIDKYGAGTAAFASKAIEIYCK